MRVDRVWNFVTIDSLHYLPLGSSVVPLQKKKPTWQPSSRHLADSEKEEEEKKKEKNSIFRISEFWFQPFRFTSADHTHTWPSTILTYIVVEIGDLYKGKERKEQESV
jgi:hypothetical protein